MLIIKDGCCRLTGNKTSINMRTIASTLALLLIVSTLEAQVTNKIKTYKLAHHGLTLSIPDQWNFYSKTSNSFEFLNGCELDEFCANIQVGVESVLEAESINNQISDLINSYKSTYSYVVAKQSTDTINGISFSLVDFSIKEKDQYLFQTVGLFKTEEDQVVVCYSSEVSHNYQEAKQIYIQERNEFLTILESIQISKCDKEQDSPKDFTFQHCNDSNSFLISQKDNLTCMVQYQGDIRAARNNTTALVMGIEMRTFLARKQPFQEVGDDDNMALYKFAYNMSSIICNQFDPGNSKFQFYFDPDTLDNQQVILIWIPVNDVNQWKKDNGFKRSNKWNDAYGRKSVSDNVFASFVLDNYIYTIQLYNFEKKSILSLKPVFRKLLDAFEYSYDNIDLNNLCGHEADLDTTL